MVLNFGNQLLGGYEKEYSDEFFATETEAGIGKVTPHWWDTVDKFDHFTGANGAAVDATKWDTNVESAGVVDIQNNKGRASCPGQADVAELILKDALTDGQLVSITPSGAIYADSAVSGAIFYLGNATDGWTLIKKFPGTADNKHNLDPLIIEAIYKGSNNWDTYYNNVLEAQLHLPNGLKIKYFTGTTLQTVPHIWLDIDELYIK